MIIECDMIYLNRDGEVWGVLFIGKIDMNIYRCVSENITEDDVIITEERISHIKERHPYDFEKYCDYLRKIVEEPDYIIQSNKSNTALIWKAFDEEDNSFKTILRLKTSSDDPKFKNSIITFMRINKKEWNRLLRNKPILYKKE